MEDKKDLQVFQKTINGRSAILIKNAQKEQAIINHKIKNEIKAEEEASKRVAKIREEIKKAQAADDEALEKELISKKEKLQKEYEQASAARRAAERKIRETETEDLNKALIAIETSYYSKLSAIERQQHQAKVAEELEAEKKKYEEELAIAKAAGAKKEELSSIEKKIKTVDKNQKAAAQESERLLLATGSSREIADHKKNKAEKAQTKVEDAKKNVKLALANDADVLKAEKKLEQARKSGNKQAIQDTQKALKEAEKAAKKKQAYLKAEQDLETASHEAEIANKEALRAETKASFEEAGKQLKENAKEQLSAGAALKNTFNAANALANAVDGNVQAMFGEQGKINTRLQGSGLEYGSIVDKVKTNVGMSGVVSQKDVVAKMVQLADSGVAYNLEMRAFLASTAENIASTFDAFDSNLLRLIRIQQADTTAARIGMEQTLTELFNKHFSDTSYMNQGGAADTVSATIIDAMSQMTKDNALSFEYTLQKWLGSLYSLGLSDSAVSTIAEGINYLGTGNVAALNGNDALQTLLAMSASRSGGKSYAELLTDGLNSDETNKLMKAMIEYLAEIAKSQENMVTKAAFSDLFGMTITDLSTFAQLQASEVQNLYNNNLEYSQMMTKTQSQLASMTSRLNIGTIIDTAMENAMVGAATNIGGNPALYGTWKVLNMVEDLTGGIAIPAVSIMGNMVDLHSTVTGIAKAGIAGLSLMSNLLGGLFGGNLFGTLAMDQWGYSEYNKRGGAITQLMSGSSAGVSESMSMVGSASGDDIKSTSMNDATDEAQEDAGTSSEEMQKNKDWNTEMLEAVNGTESTSVITLLGNIEQLLNPDRVFYTSMSGMLTPSSTVSSLLKNYASATQSEIYTSVTSSHSNSSALTQMADSVVTLANNTQQRAQSAITANGSTHANGDEVTLSDIILQAVGAAIFDASNNITFKTHIENDSGKPIPVTSTNYF